MAQIIHDVLATSIQRENERIEKEKAEAVENKRPKEEQKKEVSKKPNQREHKCKS